MASTTNFLLFKVTVEPYENDDESYVNLTEMLDDPKPSYEAMTSGGDRFELDGTIRKTHNIYYGTFCLVQTNELPTIVRVGSEPEDLLNGEDDSTGLGHYTSFFYDPSREMIGVQSNRNGISANGIAMFFKRNYYTKAVYFEYVINPAELARLNNITQINSFEISIAKLQNADAFGHANDQVAFKEITAIADSTNANVFRLYFGVGYEKESSLTKSSILKYARSIMRKRQDTNVTKIEVRGREGDEEFIQIIDLINNKIKLVVSLPRTRSANRIYVERIITNVLAEYNNILPDLNNYKVKAKQQ